MRTVELEHLRPAEVLSELKRCPIAYLPAGPVEWHNPANPLGTDGFIARKTAIEAAQRTGGVVYPTLFVHGRNGIWRNLDLIIRTNTLLGWTFLICQ